MHRLAFDEGKAILGVALHVAYYHRETWRVELEEIVEPRRLVERHALGRHDPQLESLATNCADQAIAGLHPVLDVVRDAAWCVVLRKAYTKAPIFTLSLAMNHVACPEGRAIRLERTVVDLLPSASVAIALGPRGGEVAHGSIGLLPPHTHETFKHLHREGTDLAVPHPHVEAGADPLWRFAFHPRSIVSDGDAWFASLHVHCAEGLLRGAAAFSWLITIERLPLMLPESVLESLDVAFENSNQLFLGPAKLELGDLLEVLVLAGKFFGLQLLQHLAFLLSLAERADLPQLFFQLHLLLATLVGRLTSRIFPRGMQKFLLRELEVDPESVAI
mmetsp:Transcript_110167/g.310663  ORF Transcript_110167/g.310663 Transcript_110167/m.310663 type:complete len:332 (-) Transcript_110167:1189-2184(-)